MTKPMSFKEFDKVASWPQLIFWLHLPACMLLLIVLACTFLYPRCFCLLYVNKYHYFVVAYSKQMLL